MDFETQQSDGMQRVAEMISDIRVCMLTTRDDTGHLVSRPMAPLQMDSSGSIWFFTNRNSAKTGQLENANLCFSDPANADYASLSGSATLEFDREMIDELWSTAAEPWFPKGKDDPDLALLRFDTERAEMWDANDSRMVRVLALAAAAVTGKPNAILEGEHLVVRNPGH